ncbi:MAG: AMP-binding protein [Clostridia bacterium]|nr:AMP-binding protein [Clostridia bacterium]
MSKNNFPLTGPQMNIWQLELVNSGHHNLNSIFTVMKLPKDTDLVLLDKTLNKIREVNDSLRLRFVFDENSNISQYIDDYKYIPSRIIQSDSEDISSVIENEKSDYLTVDGKVNELAIIKTPYNCFVLYKSHHILSDGWGMTQVADQIKEIYCSLENNISLDDYKKPSYLDFITRTQEYLNSSRYEKDKEYWNECVKEIEPSTFLKNANNIDKTANRIEYEIPKNMCKLIEDFCNNNKITEYSFFLALISVYFYKIYGANNFAIGTPFLNRQKRFGEFEETGLHISTLPLHVFIDNMSDFVELCRNINSKNLGLYKHGSFPYHDIQQMFNQNKAISSNIYEIGFSYQINVSEKEFNSKCYDKSIKESWNKGIGECEWLFSGEQNNAITFHLTQLNVRKLFAIDYLTSLFSDVQIERIYEDVFYLADQVLKTENTDNTFNISDFQIINDDEISLMEKFNNTGDMPAYDKNVIDYLEEIVQKHPSKAALIFENSKMSYKDFYTRVNILADNMIDKGILPNSPIVLLFDKSFEMIVSMFAILKVGCYYVPILPDESKARIEYIINDCKPSLILTHKNYSTLISKYNIDYINVDNLFVRINSELNEDATYDNVLNTNSLQISIKNKSIKPTDIAYTIYTSGSTGNPKGVQVMHKNIISLMESMRQSDVLKPSFHDVSMSLLKYSFDASGIDIYSSILFGGTLVVVGKNDELNPVRVLELIEKYGVTRSFLIPKWIENIVNTEELYNYDISSLKLLGTGGEVLKPSILKDFLAKYPNLKIINLYGPTEVTMFTTFKVFGDDEIEANYSSIGKPIPGSRIAIINPENLVLPTNCEGELVIYEDETSIKNIASGYLNLPEQTGKRFIKFYNPICGYEVSGYRTGDIAKINDKLELEFIGRNDDIVKVNGGYLVALNEVEAKIADLLGNTIEGYCVCVPYKNTKVIVLFVNNTEKTVYMKHIKRFLKENLSFYMQPRKIIELDEIPRLTSGKVNRQVLKNLAIEELKNQNKNIIKPRSNVEIEIYNIVKNLIHSDDFSITDDFLDDLGIDSLLLTSISVALNHYKLNMQDLYNYPNIQDLAQFIESNANESGLKAEIADIENIDLAKLNSSGISSPNNSTSSAFDISTVLLTGVTGFLGIHILHELLFNKKVKHIYCIIRNKIGIDASSRLKEMIDFYYNSDEKLFDLINKKVIILNGEICKPNFNLDEDAYRLLQSNVTTVINCAANVKHFSKPAQIKVDNVTSVDNMISFCGDKISLAHISTLSIAGFKGRSTIDTVYDENCLWIKQIFNNNPYLISKFNAEKHILSCICNSGLKAKIFRLGNIMPRQSDGVFQRNASQNMFLNAFKSILNLGTITEDMLNLKVEFSPVDECADSIVKLLSDNSSVIYHILNNNEITIRKIISIFEKFGYSFEIVSPYKFSNALNSLDDAYVKEYIMGTNLNKYSQKISLKALKNSGFEWSITDDNYIKNIIDLIKIENDEQI